MDENSFFFITKLIIIEIQGKKKTFKGGFQTFGTLFNLFQDHKVLEISLVLISFFLQVQKFIFSEVFVVRCSTRAQSTQNFM